MLIFLPAQSDLSLMTCYLSFSPTAWKIMGSRASSQAKASGNRLRHAPHTSPLYLHSLLHWDSFSLSFPRPLLHSVKFLCVLSHLFCSSRAVPLTGLAVQLTVSNSVKQLQTGAYSSVCMQRKLLPFKTIKKEPTYHLLIIFLTLIYCCCQGKPLISMM